MKRIFAAFVFAAALAGVVGVTSASASASNGQSVCYDCEIDMNSETMWECAERPFFEGYADCDIFAWFCTEEPPDLECWSCDGIIEDECQGTSDFGELDAVRITSDGSLATSLPDDAEGRSGLVRGCRGTVLLRDYGWDGETQVRRATREILL